MWIEIQSSNNTTRFFNLDRVRNVEFRTLTDTGREVACVEYDNGDQESIVGAGKDVLKEALRILSSETTA